MFDRKVSQLGSFIPLAVIFLLVLISLFYSEYHYLKRLVTSRLHHCPIPRQKGNDNYYAQQYEDYILSIIFSRVSAGTYIDVGAYHPLKDSVTQYFYNEGWHGINIEPSAQYYQLFVKARPRDINLNIGVGNKIQTLAFYKIGNTGLSTFDIRVAEQAKKDGFPFAMQKLPITTLNHILETNHVKAINFIKIDVEGFEKQVLQGLNLHKYRPQIFIIEATEPRTSLPSYQKWEAILNKNNYKFAYSDGINRYYIANENINLLMNRFAKANECLMLFHR